MVARGGIVEDSKKVSSVERRGAAGIGVCGVCVLLERLLGQAGLRRCEF